MCLGLWKVDQLRGENPFRHEELIGWNPPVYPAIKINKDGASEGNPKQQVQVTCLEIMMVSG